MGVIDHLEPKPVMHWFEEIAAIPHGSLKEEKLSARIVAFAEEKGLVCFEDAYHNVLVRKEGTPGYEDKPTLVLQAHIDMVWDKEKDLDFDFETQGLNLGIDGDRIHANGTTLGADDGIGAAFMLALLDSEDIAHPPLEAVFTTAEEIGMVGVRHFDMHMITGKRMINFDAGGFTEGRIYVGCAGNMKATMRQMLTYEPCRCGGKIVRVVLGGLRGGHSGGDIDKGRGNSSVIMGRILRLLTQLPDTKIASFVSGDVEQENKNGMPVRAVIEVCTQNEAEVLAHIETFAAVLRDELQDVDDAVTLTACITEEKAAQVLCDKSVENTIALLALLPHGVHSMQRVFPDTPECSCNIGNVEIENGTAVYYLSVRSCKDSLLDFMEDKFRALASLTGSEVSFDLRLPGWDYAKDSPIRKLVESQYTEQFNRAPRFKVTHASTECSMFKVLNPDMDIISMGPIIYEEHTSKEWMGIESIGALWEFLKNILRRM